MVEFQFICPFFDSSDNNLLLSEFFFVLELPPESDDGAVFGLGGRILLLILALTKTLATGLGRLLGQRTAGKRGLDVIHLLLHRVKCFL